MRHLAFSLAFIVVLNGILGCSGAQAQTTDRVEVGTDITIRLALQTPLSSKLNEVKDPIRAVLYDDLIVDGNLVLLRGTEFLGQITHLKPAGRGQRQAQMAIIFDRIKTAYGLEEISTVLTAIDDYTNDRKLKGDGEGVVRGGRDAGRTVENVYKGGAIGSLGAASVILIGQSSGAAVAGGIAIAGGLGAGLLLSKGSEINLQPGTIFRIKFERPMTLPVIQKSVDQKTQP